jgi:hypothetical protein
MPYTIIGGDGKLYGPITAEDVRQWMDEGRLNAQSMAKGEGDAEFRPLSAFPEFADALTAKTPRPDAPTVLSSTAELPARDYDLAIGDNITRGWQLVKKNFWPAVGVSFLVLLVITVINQVFGLFSQPVINVLIHQHKVSAGGILIISSTSIISAPIYTLFMAGLYKYFLKLIRGENAALGDAFSGFGPSSGQLILLGLVQAVLVLIGYAFCFVPGIYLNVAWFFSMPLVIDKGMGFWDAMELSRKMVNKHWFVVLGFLIVCGLLAASGTIACCVGVFVTMPIGFAALMYAYESIFSETQNR